MTCKTNTASNTACRSPGRRHTYTYWQVSFFFLSSLWTIWYLLAQEMPVILIQSSVCFPLCVIVVYTCRNASRNFHHGITGRLCSQVAQPGCWAGEASESVSTRPGTVRVSMSTSCGMNFSYVYMYTFCSNMNWSYFNINVWASSVHSHASPFQGHTIQHTSELLQHSWHLEPWVHSVVELTCAFQWRLSYRTV